jgi:LmbE family N-acetylglucosaminyl deacetylase
VASSLEVYSAIPASVMVIVAHPDDAEFMVSGTVARWARAGSEIVYLLVTDGNKGSSDPEATPEQLARLRQEEQRAAGRVLGLKDVEFLHYEDGMVEPTIALRRDITRVIRRHKPLAAICQDPTRFYSGRGYINHPDHRAVGEAALAAIYPAARDRLTFPELLAEGLEPHKVREVFIGASEGEDVIVDISETIGMKVEALKAHKSQIGAWDAGTMIQEWAAQAATDQSFAFGETYRYIKLGGDDD